VFPLIANIPIQKISNQYLEKYKVELFIQREDLIHTQVSGNKWRKLKYNIKEYYKEGCENIITFGGAFSNHIAATAAIGQLLNIPTFGIIRGEKIGNHTLDAACENGMILHFVTREEYKKKHQSEKVKNIINSIKKPFVIPEGGSNLFGLKGCEEILQSSDFDIITCPCGTGSTLSGIISSLKENQHAIGFSVLKGAGFLKNDIRKNLQLLNCKNRNWKLETNFHFGGYAKYQSDLIQFIRQFWKLNSIKLDPIYTGKAMYGLYCLIESGQLTGKKILFVHTGGLQGIKGFENRYKLKIF
tara:strand:- start:650 stop:1549 length:900 start_codon:yes stop_codon:yes gene_type:complete